MESGVSGRSGYARDASDVEVERHAFVGESNAFSCSQVCGLPPEAAIHYSFREQELIETAMANLQQMREMAEGYADGDPEC